MENFVSNYIKFENLGSMVNIFLKMLLSRSVAERYITKPEGRKFMKKSNVVLVPAVQLEEAH